MKIVWHDSSHFFDVNIQLWWPWRHLGFKIEQFNRNGKIDCAWPMLYRFYAFTKHHVYKTYFQQQFFKLQSITNHALKAHDEVNAREVCRYWLIFTYSIFPSVQNMTHSVIFPFIQFAILYFLIINRIHINTLSWTSRWSISVMLWTAQPQHGFVIVKEDRAWYFRSNTVCPPDVLAVTLSKHFWWTVC